MKVNELNYSAAYKLASVLSNLQENYKIHLNFSNVNFDQLTAVYESCRVTRRKIVESASHNTAHRKRKYAESQLIQEAIQIFLNDVSPERFDRYLKNTNARGENNG